MSNVLILDGYLDEPTCLGVPPYISPYPRYIAGGILSADKTSDIQYMTIDQIRQNAVAVDFTKFDLIIVIAGMVVPGRYLSGRPVSPRELVQKFEKVSGPKRILCGPAARFGFGLRGGKSTISLSQIGEVFDAVITGDPEIVIHNVIIEKLDLENIDLAQHRSSPSDIAEFAVYGASLITQHPNFPDYLIAEIETYRGCARSIVGGCTFCSEACKGVPRFRSEKDIAKEVGALYKTGLRHIRLGNQACFFSYKAFNVGEAEFPRPNPFAIQRLFRAIHRFAPDLKTLHIDNANPGIISRFPKECRKIAKIIVKHHTSGDVVGLGVESVDPKVIKINNLKAEPEEVMAAIHLLNEVGKQRGYSGLPELLPGLNFIAGLPGETKKTYKLAFDFLKEVLNNHLLVRRINIRQVLPLPGTPMQVFGSEIIQRHQRLFRHFKYLVRTEIEKPLLNRLVPIKTLLRNLYTECYRGNLTFCRQLGSYPLLVGIPGKLPLQIFIDAKIVDYGYRSVTAIPFPLDLNTAAYETLTALPKIGSKRAKRIIQSRPVSIEDLINILDEPTVFHELKSFISN